MTSKTWKVYKLKEIGLLVDGDWILNKDYSPSGVRLIQVGDVGVGRFVGKSSRFISHESASELGCTLLNKGDILISRMPDPIGRACELPDLGYNAITAVDVSIWRPNASIADSRFLIYLLSSQEWFSRVKSLASGATRPRISRSVLENLTLYLPPLDEQRRIAKRLNEQMAAVESARKAAEEQLRAAWELLPAYLRGVFESQEAKEWKVLRLGDVGEIVGGVQRTPNRAPTKFHKPYLTVRNVKQGYLDLTQIERFEVTPNEFERCRLHFGDILIVEGNGSIDQIGRNALFDLDEAEWIHQNHIIRVRLPHQTFDPKFVSLFLNSHLGRLQMVEKAMTTSGLYTLSSGKVASLVIPSPSLDKQQEIVHNLENKVANINKIQSSLESQLAEINRLPASLLREGFAGRV